ncbi:MAG TPA: sigma factor-like helix-turn-helix DNA-binding protein [Solirubrobacteraceae bacterium]|nr:sigma factor-like helix-turn-helix DNA-binding protein [Solirubrobacteraceae bacterium]
MIAAASPSERAVPAALGAELSQLARQILGPGPAAAEACAEALAGPVGNRLEGIARTAAECRRRDGTGVVLELPVGGTLAETLLAELELAHAALAPRHREALALAGLCGLSHAEIGEVMGLDTAAVALLLARARLALREELRGAPEATRPDCGVRERALRVLSRRQDGEPVGREDTTWLGEHLATCRGCARDHGAVLEAALRYRGWVRP